MNIKLHYKLGFNLSSLIFLLFKMTFVNAVKKYTETYSVNIDVFFVPSFVAKFLSGDPRVRILTADKQTAKGIRDMLNTYPQEYWNDGTFFIETSENYLQVRDMFGAAVREKARQQTRVKIHSLSEKIFLFVNKSKLAYELTYVPSIKVTFYQNHTKSWLKFLERILEPHFDFMSNVDLVKEEVSRGALAKDAMLQMANRIERESSVFIADEKKTLWPLDIDHLMHTYFMMRHTGGYSQKPEIEPNALARFYIKAVKSNGIVDVDVYMPNFTSIESNSIYIRKIGKHAGVKPSKPRLMVLGHAQHGKDTVAEILRDVMSLSYLSSSVVCCEEFLFDAIKEEFGYVNEVQCYEDRGNHRTLWHWLIKLYNWHDKAALSRLIFEERALDMYVGIRADDEFRAAKEEGLFDCAVYVDATERLPPESKSSFDVDITREFTVDATIDNNGSPEMLEKNVHHFIDRLLYLHGDKNEYNRWHYARNFYD